MPIYFIEAGDKAAIKIGKSEKSVEGRLRTLQLGNHLPLKLIREFPGDFWQEAWIHAYFSPHKLRGEWFSFVPEMLTVIPPRSPHAERDERRRWFHELPQAKKTVLMRDPNFKL